MDVLVDGTMERWFTDKFISTNESAIAPIRDLVRTTPVQGYTSCIGAIMKLDITDRLTKINLPTLVIAGEDDESTPLAANEAIHHAIGGSEFLAVPNAKHFVNIEQSALVNDALSRFLSDQVSAKT